MVGLQKEFNKLTRSYKLIVLDLDGTLVDLNVDWVNLRKELESLFLEDTGELTQFSPLNQKLLEIKKSFGTKLHQKLLRSIERYELEEKNYVVNHRLIQLIENSDHKIAIYSMNSEKCVRAFVKKNLTKKPEIIISKETCTEPKPTGADLKKLINQINLEQKDVLFIGNTEEDRLSGILAKVDTVIIKSIK